MMYSTSPWCVQPQGPTWINRQHSLASSVLCWFNAGGSFAVKGRFPTTQSGKPSIGPAGRCIDYTAQKSVWPYDADIANGLITSAGCSALIIFTVDSLTNYGGLLSYQDTLTLRNALELRIGEAATDSKFCVIRGVSSGAGALGLRQFSTAANRTVLGLINRLMVSFPSNDVQAAPTLTLNGVEYSTTNTAGTATGNVALPTATGLCLGQRSSDTVSQLDGMIFNCWLFSRAATSGEALELTNNLSSPFKLFNKPSKFFALDTAAAAATTPMTPYWYRQHIAAGMYGECA